MKRFYTLLLFLLLACLSYGQVVTAYEKKCYSLKLELLRNLGVDELTLKKSNQMSDLEGLLVAGKIVQKLNTEKGLTLLLAYERQLKEAEKLKTALDFQREKSKKDEAERVMQNDLAKKEERNRQQIKKERYDNSDYVQISKKIQNEYKEWLEKSEFEKSDDYQNRISNSSSAAFDKIAYKIIIEKIKAKPNANFKLLKYNADTEKFGIEFSFSEIIIDDSLSIPLSIAAEFKEEFKECRLEVADRDWGFIDNYLIPSKVTLVTNFSTGKKAYQFYFIDKEFKTISFTTSEFNIILPNNVNHKFNYIDYYDTRVSEIEDQALESSNRKIISSPKVVSGNRKIIRYYSFSSDLPKANIYAIIKVGTLGQGTLVGFAKGSTSRDQTYEAKITEYLANIQFDKSSEESNVILLFNFN